jgi:hypothetical protein
LLQLYFDGEVKTWQRVPQGQRKQAATTLRSSGSGCRNDSFSAKSAYQSLPPAENQQFYLVMGCFSGIVLLTMGHRLCKTGMLAQLRISL